MKKPLFDVHLKVWENWEHFLKSIGWWAEVLCFLQDPIYYLKNWKSWKEIGKGKKRQIAGAYNPYSNEVHLYLDEIAYGAIARLERKGLFSSQNYQVELAKELVGTLVHELFHSLESFDTPSDNEHHIASQKKMNKIFKQSMWYSELIRVCHVLQTTLFNVKDSKKESDNVEDFGA